MTTDLHIANGARVEGGSGDVWIIDGIVSSEATGLPCIDARGLTVVPGFVDIQINGAFGHDFTEDPTSIWDVGARLPEQGVTSFCPTIITSPPGHLAAAQAAIADRPDGYLGAEPIGLHVEGPYISDAQRGTHPSEHLLPCAPHGFRTENIAIVTVAPELPGVIDFIEHLVDAGVIVALGHSMATSTEANMAIDAGASLGTHLFNAMSPMTAREPGLAGALLANPDVHFDVIADGIHLAPEMLRLAWSSASERLILVTDAISAAGMPEGRYKIGQVLVDVRDGIVRNDDGLLAGSALTMDRALRVLMQTAGATLGEAVGAATSHPARLLGRPDLGSLSVGARGDAVLLDGTEVVATVVDGRVMFGDEPG